jgi:NAD(P)-dependent dehydrogenase (short-subunit alcohol dehydrogenase family)
MELQLAAKTVLISGLSAGIGFATAVGFAREGAAVILNGRNPARLEAAAARLCGCARRSQARRCGWRPPTSARRRDARRSSPRRPDVDVLVNNAAIFEPKPFGTIPDSDWMQFFETNVMSGVRLARHHLGRMLDRNSGRILFVASESALQIAMTKTAQLAISRGLSELTRGTKVTANTVLPGPTATEGVGDYMRKLTREQGLSDAAMEKQFFTTVRPSSLLQRWSTADEVANLLVFLGGGLASATNGAAMRSTAAFCAPSPDAPSPTGQRSLRFRRGRDADFAKREARRGMVVVGNRPRGSEAIGADPSQRRGLAFELGSGPRRHRPSRATSRGSKSAERQGRRAVCVVAPDGDGRSLRNRLETRYTEFVSSVRLPGTRRVLSC